MMPSYSKHAETYQLKMLKKMKAKLIIFNQESFYCCEPRIGTQKDAETLKETFEAFHFEIDEYKDFTKHEIFETIRSLPNRRNNLSDYEYIMVAILTHGSGNRLRAKDQQFSETEIIKELALIELATAKPVFLIAQACRGTKSVLGPGVFDVPDAVEPYTLPVEADWLVNRNYIERSPLDRNELHKSPIQELCEHLDNFWSNQDLESILTSIRREHESRTSKKGIISNTTSTFTRKLYIRNFSEIESLSNQTSLNINSEVMKNDLNNAVESKSFSNFMDHFSCIKKKLKFYVEKNPLNNFARAIWRVGNITKDDDNFIPTKQKVCEAFSKHLYNDFQHTSMHKFADSCDFQCPITPNKMSLSKDAKTYELERFEKNRLIILNLDKRPDTEKDVEELKKTFGKFGCEVVEHTDITKDEIIKATESFTSNENLSEYGFVAVAVLTHGSNDNLLRAKDQYFTENDIMKALNVPALASKPKLLLIQKYLDEDVEPDNNPLAANMLVFFSAFEGSPSIRCAVNGTWFIQQLCKTIKEYPYLDLVSIMKKVQKDLAINNQIDQYDPKTCQMVTFKQMPVQWSTLTDKLYLQIDHFSFLKERLNTFVENNPNDDLARFLLDTVNDYQNNDNFDEFKLTMVELISNHLVLNTHNY